MDTVQDDPAEYLETLDMLSGKPRAIRGCHNVILEDKCLKSAFLLKTSQLDVIQGTTKDVGRGVDVGRNGRLPATIFDVTWDESLPTTLFALRQAGYVSRYWRLTCA